MGLVCWVWGYIFEGMVLQKTDIMESIGRLESCSSHILQFHVYDRKAAIYPETKGK